MNRGGSIARPRLGSRLYRIFPRARYAIKETPCMWKDHVHNVAAPKHNICTWRILIHGRFWHIKGSKIASLRILMLKKKRTPRKKKKISRAEKHLLAFVAILLIQRSLVFSCRAWLAVESPLLRFNESVILKDSSHYCTRH